MLRIAVCVKQVPEVSELALDPVTLRIRRDGVPALINPFDRRALLEAIRLRDEVGATVTAISMGPPQAEAALREALGLGVDRAVHLCDVAFAGSDTLATARALARAIGQMGADLVLAGRYSIDAETGQVGPEIAELLGATYLGGVRRLAFETTAEGDAALRVECEGDAALRVECEGDDGACEVMAPLPAVVTCTDRWKTRAPIVMPDDTRAAEGAVERWGVDRVGDAGELGQAGSPTWVAAVEPVAISRARRRLDAREDVGSGVRAALAAITAAVARGGDEAVGRPPRHLRRPDPRGAVWVVAERAVSGALRPVSLELLASADDLAAELGVGVCALLLEPLPRELLARARGEGGARSIEDEARALGHAGADTLLTEDGEPFHVDGAVAAIASAIADLAPRIVLAPATALGRDVVPGIAARLGLGLTGDAIGVALDAEGRLRQLKPAFGGQIVAPILSRTRPELATVRPGMGRPVTADPGRPDADILRRPRVAARVRGARWFEYRSEVSGEAAALESARIVVCIGYGLGARERVAGAEAVARLLGGAVGATRRVCDSGWVPRQLQIGLSGRSVAPAAYLALGVRGSFNHLVGIQRAGAIVAVNRDPDAEIFAGADLGIVADAPSFLAELQAQLEGRG